MLPDPNRAGGGPRLLLMVGAPPLGPCAPRTSLRNALRGGLAARARLAAASWPAGPAPENETFGRDDALEEG